MRARNPPLLPLVMRESRALFSTPAPWILLGAAGPLAGLEMSRALPLLSTIVLPIVVARAFARTNEQRVLLQIGYRGASIAFAKTCAVLIAVLLAVVVVGAVVLWQPTDAPLISANILYALVITGIGAAVQGRLFVTWGIAGALWLLAENGRWRGDVVGIIAKHAPSSLIAPFGDGVIDVGAAAELLVIALGLLALSAALAPAPPERQLKRAIVVGVILGVALLGATRIRTIVDVDPRASFPAHIQAALANVKDPVRIEMTMDPAMARKLERALADVRVVWGDGDVVEVAGRRAKASERDLVPTILELAGQERPALVDDVRPPKERRNNPAAPWIAFVIVPLGALVIGARRR